MLSFPPSVRLFVAARPIDGRKAPASVMALVRDVLDGGGTADARGVFSFYGLSDCARSRRNLVEPGRRPTLGVKAFMAVLEGLAPDRGFPGRVYKRNAQEEHVVALIFLPQGP